MNTNSSNFTAFAQNDDFLNYIKNVLFYWSDKKGPKGWRAIYQLRNKKGIEITQSLKTNILDDRGDRTTPNSYVLWLSDTTSAESVEQALRAEIDRITAFQAARDAEYDRKHKEQALALVKPEYRELAEEKYNQGMARFMDLLADPRVRA